MGRTDIQIRLAMALILSIVSTAEAQRRSPDPYQQDAVAGQDSGARQQQQPKNQSRTNRASDASRLGGPGQRQGQSQDQGRNGNRRGPGGGADAGQRRTQEGGPNVGQRDGGASRNPVVLALDVDRDGELSADEIRSAAASLGKLDANSDGRVSREEMRPADSREAENRPDRESPLGSRPARSPREESRLGRPSAPPQRPEMRPTEARAALELPQRSQPAPADGFALIPAGEFQMGDHHELGGQEHRNDEVPIHPVSINAFLMQRTETTNQQYCEFLNDALVAKSIEMRDGQVVQSGANIIYCDTFASDDASQIALNARKRFVVRPGTEMHPVVCIRWHGATAYCNWLSKKEGVVPCYDNRTWVCDFTQKGYRLPTEAEWEYAGRGGLTTTYRIFPWGDEPDGQRANWPNSGDPFETGPYPWTTPVAFYNGTTREKDEFNWPGEQATYATADGANGYGLYDMSGNVWEWTGDWYNRDYYANGPTKNPTGPGAGTPVQDGNAYQVLRSGSWFNGQWGHGRVSNRNPSYYRGPDDPNHSFYHIGFRPVQPTEGNVDANQVARLASGPPQTRQPDTALRPSLLESSGVDLGHGVPGDDQVRANGRTLGLLVNDTRAFNGYTLFAPKHNTMVYLIDNEGRVVNRWDTQYEPGQSVYLLENGHLLHCCFTRNGNFTRGGEGGRLEEYDWEGNLVWEFEYSSDKVLSHHDIAPLPNGNVLLLAVELKTQEECIEAGFDPQMLRDGHLFPEHIIEVKKTGPTTGDIVWKWHVWDHLVQDFSQAKSNYGDVARHPELVDVHGSRRGIPAFWNHGNSIDYNAKLDQIVLSVRGFNEIWVIDHSTTTAEAASHSGGQGGRGGDLVWRWGNPIAYQNGRVEDRQLFQQHDAQWILDDCPGAGNLLIFNNGLDRGFTSVIEIKPPVDQLGHYSSYDAPIVWEYRADPRGAFYSSEISGAHRLPNGNTLICAGCVGNFLEVTSDGEIVWRYANAVVREGILAADGEPGTDHRGHQWNAVFKIHRYAADYAGLAGKTLTPSDVIEQPIGALMLATGDRSKRKGGVGKDRGEGGRGGGQGGQRPDDQRRGGGDRREGNQRGGDRPRGLGQQSPR
ncbi:MAG: SUMF1/EgtB/PvdO family nonheme iron enzyme [Fuerstiella sp.]|nr:SUMF1/EgtB/PvdO family nonheme iron enzyme [Fuerstiella sp.]